MDAAAAARAGRWDRLAGRFLSWLSNTTTMRSCWPAERALTWLGLNLEMAGRTLARAVELAAQPRPVSPVTLSAAAPSNEAALRGVKDMLKPRFRPAHGFLGSNPAVLVGCSTRTADGS